MDGNVGTSGTYEKLESLKSLEFVNLNGWSNERIGNGSLGSSGEVGGILKRARSSLTRKYGRKSRVDGNGSSTVHETGASKNNLVLGSENHGGESGISTNGDSPLSGVLKKKRDGARRKNGKNSWVGSNGNSCKDNGLWVRNSQLCGRVEEENSHKVEKKTEVAEDQNERKQSSQSKRRNRKEMSLNRFDQQTKKRKRSVNDALVVLGGSTLKKSRSKKKVVQSVANGDSQDKGQLQDAVDVALSTEKTKDSDHAAKKPSGMEGNRPKRRRTAKKSGEGSTSTRVRNHGGASRGLWKSSRNTLKARPFKSSGEFAKLAKSLCAEKPGDVNGVKEDKSSACATVDNHGDAFVSSNPNRRKNRNRLPSAKVDVNHGNGRQLVAASSMAGPSQHVGSDSAENSNQQRPSNTDAGDALVSLNISKNVPQDDSAHGRDCTELLPPRMSDQPVEGCVSAREDLSGAGPSAEDPDKFQNMPLEVKDHDDSRTARMLFSQFSSGSINLVSSDVPAIQQSPNASLLSMLLRQNLSNILKNNSLDGKGSLQDGSARVLRPRRQKQKRFMDKRRRFREISYNEAYAYKVLNRRIKVYWPLDQQWYYGVVKNYDAGTNLHHVQYDDRDEERLCLGSERFKLLLFPGELKRPSSSSPRKCSPGRRYVCSNKELGVSLHESKGRFLESEPIISWLARASSKSNSSSISIMKTRVKSKFLNPSLSPVLLKDSSFDDSTSMPVDKRFCDSSQEKASSLQPKKSNFESSHAKEKLLHPMTSTKKRKSPIVYYRRRFNRRKKNDCGHGDDSASSVPDSVVDLESFELPSSSWKDIILMRKSSECRRSADPLHSLDRECLEQTVSCSQSRSAVCEFPSVSGSSLLALVFGVPFVRPDQFELVFSAQHLLLLSLRLGEGFFGLPDNLTFCCSCMLQPVWPKVYLEIAVLKNLVVQSIQLFEGWLDQAIEHICLALENLYETNESNAHEIEGHLESELPVVCIKFKLGDHYNTRQQTSFIFSHVLRPRCTFEKLDGSGNRFGNRHVVSVFEEKKPACSCVVLSGTDDVASPPVLSTMGGVVKDFLEAPPDTCLHEDTSRFRNVLNAENSQILDVSTNNLYRVSFASLPTFFQSLHLSLMMDYAIASMVLQKHAESSCRSKKKLHKNKDKSCPQVALRPELSSQSSAGRLPLYGQLKVAINAPVTSNSDALVSPDMHPFDCHTPTGTSDLRDCRRELQNNSPRGTVIRLRRSPCSMGSWRYAGMSGSSDPAESESSSLNNAEDQAPSPSSQATAHMFNWDAEGGPSVAHGSARSHDSGVLQYANRTAPRSMWRRTRVGPSRSSYSSSPKSWQEGRSNFLSNGCNFTSWKPQSSHSTIPDYVDYDSDSKSRSNSRRGRSFKRLKEDSLAGVLEESDCSYLNLLSCYANILVTVGDRGWRECGAQVNLECLDHNDWRLLVKIDGCTKYSYKAQQLVQPGTTNRFTHAMMWRGEKDWFLEFSDRSQWMLFKEMHDECYNRNIRAASVKNIPIPGVRKIADCDPAELGVPFVRTARYYRQVETDIEMALDPSHVLYDMDDEDEVWLHELKDLIDAGGDHGSSISEEAFERAVDMLEKVSFSKKREDFSHGEISDLVEGLEPLEFMFAVCNYWQAKRRKKGLPLIRQFQPALWEQYQVQLKNWEAAYSKLQISDGCNDKVEQIQKPPMFAFCLKPRGLEVVNKGSKQRSQKKFSGFCHGKGYHRDFDHHYLNGRKLYGSMVGDERNPVIWRNHEYINEASHLGYSTISPRGTIYPGYISRSNGWSDFGSPRKHVNRTRNSGMLVSPSAYQKMVLTSPRVTKRNGIMWRPSFNQLSNRKQYQSDGSMDQGSDQSGSPDPEARDPVAVAQHAAELAKHKRARAQRLSHKADIALHKAMMALVTAELIEAAENSFKG